MAATATTTPHPVTMLCRWCVDDHEVGTTVLVDAPTEAHCPWLTPTGGPHA